MEKNKILCVQISTHLINGEPDLNEISTKYYAMLYNSKHSEGYYKSYHFWEILNWISVINYNTECDFYICTDIQETIQYIINHDYNYICFSVLDVNKQIIKDIIKGYIEQSFYIIKDKSIFVLGGYIDIHEYYKYLIRMHGIEYIKIYDTIKDFIKALGIKFKMGYNYKHFKDYETIPRLTLSTGCLHKCDFCTIEKELKEVHLSIILRQLRSFAPLKFKLVYINDKTFGQCKNYKLLPGLYREIRIFNKNFEGFIIQTTTSQLLKISDDFIRKSHIKFIELGVETFNDQILKQYHKPSNCYLINLAFNKVRILNKTLKIDVQIIPNILIGIPEETETTYRNTLEFIIKNRDIISHMNIYNLAVYDNTPLSEKIKYTEEDKNEMSINKSFHIDKNTHIQFYNDIHKLGLNILTNCKNNNKHLNNRKDK